MRFIERFKKLAQQETRAERYQRMLPGAMYGLMISCAYALVGCFVNRLSFPDLPVGVDWSSLLITWLALTIWLGLGGGFINWFTQTDESIAISWLVMTISALVASAFSLDGNLSVQVSKSLLLALPVLGISLLMTFTLRWLGVHHAEALEKKGALKRRGIAALVAIALTIGGLVGTGLTRWSGDTFRGIQDLHRRLQTVATDPSQMAVLFPFSDLPGLESHRGMPYTVTGRPSGQSVVAFEAKASFTDGYQLTCVLLVFPDKNPILRACAEGEEVSLPENQ